MLRTCRRHDFANTSLMCWPLVAVVMLAGLLAVSQTRGERSGASTESSAPRDEATQRLREGTRLVNVTGHFKLTGDGITFYLHDSDRRLQVLENLNLERISAVVGDTPDPLEWTITGTVTEFGGANFLLVTQAAIKSRNAAASQR